MFPGYRIGTLFGIPIRLKVSFLVLLGVILLWMGGLQGVAVALVAFASVVLHELGHALTARRLGVPVGDIELHFFGGAARIADLPRTPEHEIAIAAAGPAVSFALAGIGYGLAALTGVGFFTLLAFVNVMLGAFNLLPAFPSDGGRILRALLARKRGLVRATDLAVRIGRGVLVTLGVAGLVSGHFQVALVALVLWMMGTAEGLAVRMRGEPPGWRGRQSRAEEAEVVYIPPPASSRTPPRPARPVVVIWR
jgi:Zn-dependent protease